MSKIKMNFNLKKDLEKINKEAKRFTPTGIGVFPDVPGLSDCYDRNIIGIAAVVVAVCN